MLRLRFTRLLAIAVFSPALVFNQVYLISKGGSTGEIIGRVNPARPQYFSVYLVVVVNSS